MLVTPFPIVTLVRELHPSNALFSILVTESGIVILLRIQLLNAFSPMLVTLLGIITLVRFLQWLNALIPILVT